MTITIKIVATNDQQMPTFGSFSSKNGQTLMQAATAAGIDAIAADCGGVLTCATCHVYIAEPWASKLPEPSADERSMLDMTAAERRATSRLSCQIQLTAALDGLEIEWPDRQY
jgi:ferredoxin, 2Fe-2S